ncbi:hypothetical protein MKEN_00556100 [Mycena kentingensis (nom. inval.)]|nr:hypothetical protein MKEN_00556100 [Mycena kentingensis (nom. inval.)]
MSALEYGGALLPLYACPPPEREPMRVVIIAENFLPKVDGSTVTIANLLQQLKTMGVQAMLFGPESGMAEYAGAKLFGTYGVPLRVYPGLKVNFISPAFIRTLREFDPHVIHLVDPIWLGVQALAAISVLFPSVPVVTSHHTNLPTYAEIFGYPYYPHRTWQIHAYLHSFARCTLVPSVSTAGLLAERGFVNLRVVSRGVDLTVFDPSLRSESMRQAWLSAAAAFPPSTLPVLSRAPSSSAMSTFSTSASREPTILLSVGRLSPEKNLPLLIDALSSLPPSLGTTTTLVFIGDGPSRPALLARCAARGIRAVFTGHLSGRALGAAVASGDVLCAPSLTETFGQTTLQGMAAGLPVVGLLAEGTADLVVHGHTGLLLDVRAAAEGRAPWSPTMAVDGRVVGWGEAAPLCAEDAGSARANIVARLACLLEVLIEDGERRRAMGRGGGRGCASSRGEAVGGDAAASFNPNLPSLAEAKSRTPSPGGLGPAPVILRQADTKAPSIVTAPLLPRTQAIVSMPRGIQYLLDSAVVLHALSLALANHAAYLIPSGRDVRERVGRLLGWR